LNGTVANGIIETRDLEHFAADFLGAKHHDPTISIINAGVSGETIIDLQSR